MLSRKTVLVLLVITCICAPYAYHYFSLTNYFEIRAAEGTGLGDVEIDESVPETDYSGIPFMSKSSKVMEVSAYSELDSCHYPTKEGCLVASGKIAQVGMVASNLYPFGTKLKIDGKTYVVEDRISKKYNNRIDIFQGYGEEAHEKAINLGIRHLEVEIIK